MARVVDLFGLPVTSGSVGVLEGRQCAPSDALGKSHHPLESPAVVDGAIAVPGGDRAQHDAPNGASIEICEGFRGLFSCLSCICFFHFSCKVTLGPV